MGNRFKAGSPKEYTVGGFFNILGGRKVESTAPRVLHFPQENRIKVEEKQLSVVGRMKDFFRHGPHINIKNVHGAVVREMRNQGGYVLINPGGGDPIIILDETTDVLYEPWFMDVGSLVFHSPPDVKEFTPGQILKIATENDTVVYLDD